MNRREFAGRLLGATAGAALCGPAGFSLPTKTRGAEPFRFSAMLWPLEGKRPVEQCIEDVAAAGYQGAELVSEFTKWSDADMRRVMARMRTLGLRFDAISGIEAGFADPDAGSALMAQIERHCALAEKLECRQIILLSGKRLPIAGPGAQRTASIENLKRAGELAAKRDVELVIEPIDLLEQPAIYLTSVTEAFDIVRGVGSPHVRVLYDFYHEQRGAGNLIEKLRANAGLVGLVHIADVPGRHEPGTGEIDYGNIYRALAELGYGRFIAMEFYPTGDPVASLHAAREAALRAIA